MQSIVTLRASDQEKKIQSPIPFSPSWTVRGKKKREGWGEGKHLHSSFQKQHPNGSWEGNVSLNVLELRFHYLALSFSQPFPSFLPPSPFTTPSRSPPQHTHTHTHTQKHFGSHFTRQLFCHIGISKLPRNTLSDSPTRSKPPFSDPHKKCISISERKRPAGDQFW